MRVVCMILEYNKLCKLIRDTANTLEQHNQEVRKK